MIEGKYVLFSKQWDVKTIPRYKKMCIVKERKEREGKKHDFLNDLISGGPCKCQDHPAGGRKGPCYPESCCSILVIPAL